MKGRISRRAFLKAGAAATVAACGATASPVRALAAPDGKEMLATLVDIRKCVGCEACVEGCREANAERFPEPVRPFPKMYPSRVKVEDWSRRRDETERFTPYNWLFIQRAQVTVKGEETELSIPRRCMHCVNPPCVKLCPWGAAKQYRDGISEIDPGLCLGGSKCKKVCPWDVPQRQTGTGLYLALLPSLAGNGVMYKCDRCRSELLEGGEPACIEACPEGVQEIGPRDEMVAKARRIAEEIGGYVYGEHENGGTNTLYVSPVPFSEIDAALDKGAGKPGMEPVPETMARAENVASAMLIAPVAGIAAAALKHLGGGNARKEEVGHDTDG